MWTPRRSRRRSRRSPNRSRSTTSTPATPTTLGIRLASGRLLTDSRRQSALQPVALVNERFVRDALRRASAARADRQAAAAEAAAVRADRRCVPDRRRGARRAEPRPRRAAMPEIYVPFTVDGIAEPARRPHRRRSGGRHPGGRRPGLRHRSRSAGDERARRWTWCCARTEFATPRFNLMLLSIFAGRRPGAGGRRRLRRDVDARSRSSGTRSACAWRSAPAPARSPGWSSGAARGCWLLGIVVGLVASVARRAVARAAGLERLSLRSAGVRRSSRSSCSPRVCRRACGRRAAPRGSIRSSRCVRTERSLTPAPAREGGAVSTCDSSARGTRPRRR